MTISNNNNLTIITDERRKSIVVQHINLINQQDKYDPIKLVFFENLLNRKTDNYTTPQFLKKCVELYNVKFNIKSNDYKQFNTLIYTVKYLDPALISDVNSKEIFELFNEYLVQTSFNENEFNVFKKDYLNYLKYLETQYDELCMRTLEDLSKGPDYITFKEEIAYVEKFTPQMLEKFISNLSIANQFQINISKTEFPHKLVNENKNLYVQNYDVSPFTDKIIDVGNEQASIKLLYGYENLDYTTVQMFNFILGADTTSLLFTNVRERDKLAYSVYSSTYLKQAIMISIQTNSKTVNEAIDSIKEQLNLVAKIDSEKFNAYKQKYISVLKKNEKVLNIIINNELSNLLFNENNSITKKINEIENIKIEQLQEVANKLTYYGKVVIK